LPFPAQQHEPCERGDQLDRMEAKMDQFLEGLTEVKGRLFAHELVVGSVVTLLGLGLGIWGLAK
jgi:hypothetical protein